MKKTSSHVTFCSLLDICFIGFQSERGYKNLNIPPVSVCPLSPLTRDMLVGLWLVPQWMDSGRSGALGAIARWPVPMALSRGPGSAQQPPMGDLSVAVTGQKAESAIILTAQVKILSLLILYPLLCLNWKLWQPETTCMSPVCQYIFLQSFKGTGIISTEYELLLLAYILFSLFRKNPNSKNQSCGVRIKNYI